MVLERLAKPPGVCSPCRFESYTLRYAVCPGGEGAVLKTVGPKGLAGSNPVCSVVTMADLAMQRIVVPPYMGSNPISHLYLRLSYNW